MPNSASANTAPRQAVLPSTVDLDESVPVITYRLSNGQKDEHPSSWVSESDIMRARQWPSVAIR
jgi:hypothetical protein